MVNLVKREPILSKQITSIVIHFTSVTAIFNDQVDNARLAVWNFVYDSRNLRMKSPITIKDMQTPLLKTGHLDIKYAKWAKENDGGENSVRPVFVQPVFVQPALVQSFSSNPVFIHFIFVHDLYSSNLFSSNFSPFPFFVQKKTNFFFIMIENIYDMKHQIQKKKK